MLSRPSSVWSALVLWMPRAVKLSVTKVATPMPLSSCDQRSTLPPTPPEPCNRMTAGSRSVPVRGMRTTPAIVTGLAFLSPVRNCWSESVRVGTACTSVRATCAVLVPDKPKLQQTMLAAMHRMVLLMTVPFRTCCFRVIAESLPDCNCVP